MNNRDKRWLTAAGLAAALLATAPAHAEMSATELAKLAQNPVGNLISVPFQNNTNRSTTEAATTCRPPDRPPNR